MPRRVRSPSASVSLFDIDGSSSRCTEPPALHIARSNSAAPPPPSRSFPRAPDCRQGRGRWRHPPNSSGSLSAPLVRTIHENSRPSAPAPLKCFSWALAASVSALLFLIRLHSPSASIHRRSVSRVQPVSRPSLLQMLGCQRRPEAFSYLSSSTSERTQPQHLPPKLLRLRHGPTPAPHHDAAAPSAPSSRHLRQIRFPLPITQPSKIPLAFDQLQSFFLPTRANTSELVLNSPLSHACPLQSYLPSEVFRLGDISIEAKRGHYQSGATFLALMSFGVNLSSWKPS